jgi:hypothetical protein
MSMAIDADRATRAGKKTQGKDTMSVSLDRDLKEAFTSHCDSNDLKVSPIVEDLIAQYMEAVSRKRK